jgi:hypothetical protein
MPSDVSKYRSLIRFGHLNSKEEGATIFSKRREGPRAISRAAVHCYVMVITLTIHNSVLMVKQSLLKIH